MPSTYKYDFHTHTGCDVTAQRLTRLAVGINVLAMTATAGQCVVAAAVIHTEPVAFVVTELRRALARVLVTDVARLAHTEVG